MRCMEQWREIYWEAIRAPSYPAVLDRNPYRREYLIKKLYGKTWEERLLKRRFYKAFDRKYRKIVDDYEAYKEIEGEEQAVKMS